jgi:hypothetical protein
VVHGPQEQVSGLGVVELSLGFGWILYRCATPCALVFGTFFKIGASYYGVGDLKPTEAFDEASSVSPSTNSIA